MWPFLRDGDLIDVVPGTDGARPGDILCYERDGAIFLHRVLTSGATGYRTRGDALAYVEDVPAASVLGRAVRVTRGERARRLDTRTARLWGRIVLVIAPWLLALRDRVFAIRRRHARA